MFVLIVLGLMLVLLLLTALAALPLWPYSRGWGFLPAAGILAILMVLIGLLRVGLFF